MMLGYVGWDESVKKEQSFMNPYYKTVVKSMFRNLDENFVRF